MPRGGVFMPILKEECLQNSKRSLAKLIVILLVVAVVGYFALNGFTVGKYIISSSARSHQAGSGSDGRRFCRISGQQSAGSQSDENLAAAVEVFHLLRC